MSDRDSSDSVLGPEVRAALRQRPRRLRAHPALRDLVRETRVSRKDLILPLFCVPGSGVRDEVGSMPGVFRESADRLGQSASEAADLGLPALLLFGVPEEKNALGSHSWSPDGIVQRGLAEVARAAPDVLRIVDLCFCEYTDHGHCGVLDAAGDVVNDATLENLALQAVSLADAGAQVIAPSGMMDGMIATLRAALDRAGHTSVSLLSYAAKYASAFYGPFRDAADSAPAFGDRRTYQQDPANGREALVEVALDLEQGADMVMVKPAGPCLDVIARVRDRFDAPLAAYQVSGEYAMIHAAARNGWIDLAAARDESLLAIRRAGADMLITYFARDVARARG